MIYRNVVTNVLHWDFVSPPFFNLPRKLKRAKECSPAVYFFPYHRCSVRNLFKVIRISPDRCCLRPTSGLNLNLSEILQLGKLWGSSSMVEVYDNLMKPTEDANAGTLVGNRNFYNNDYMVSSSTNTQSVYSDEYPGSARSRLCLHVENVLDADKEHRMHQLAKCLCSFIILSSANPPADFSP
jgi:hypothetical protein